MLTVFHGSELLYIYPDVVSAIVGSGVELANPQLSEWMLDYWLSFATSLDPNDGKGSNRAKLRSTIDCLTDSGSSRTTMGAI